ncbi:hypothetical protein N0V88_005625 [Collariella sp. IMI 366227]|nr:hypothetical protein N0V88_005625 [Collariella sp. IMI 366227]
MAERLKGQELPIPNFDIEWARLSTERSLLRNRGLATVVSKILDELKAAVTELEVFADKVDAAGKNIDATTKATGSDHVTLKE